MDSWFIWVIVIVLVIAIVWWLMNRNKTHNSTSTQAPADTQAAGNPGQPGATPPAATQPSDTPSMPDPAAAAAGVAGLAGVTNLGKAAAEGSGPTGDEPAADTPAEEEPHDSAAAAPPETLPATTPELTVEEPVIAAPVVDEPIVDEPVVDTDATLHAADAGDVDDWATRSSADGSGTGAPSAAAGSEAEGVSGVTADDVARADEAADAEKAADKAEWESSWTDAGGAPIHHNEYTDPHSPTLPGAETAAAEDQAGTGHLSAEHPYGVGSSSTAGADYPVKASATAMTYHDEDTAGYEDAAADVWFESSAHAEAAGFRPPRRSRH